MSERTRITASEREALMRINLGLNFLLEEPERLKRRTKLVRRGAFWLGAARSALERYMHGVYRTIPTEQLQIIRRSIMETGYTVGIKCRATADANRFSEWGVIVPIEVINTMFNACTDHCLTCMGDTEAQKKCKLRKALDILPNDTEERNDGTCPYRELM